MTDYERVRAILDAATPCPLRASGATIWKPTGDGTDTDFTGFAVAWVALDAIDGTDAPDARAIVVARNLAPELLAVAEAAADAVEAAGTDRWPVNCDRMRMALDALHAKMKETLT